MENQPKILITSPSLDESENVSGISTLVRQIIEHTNIEFRHFTAGRKDSEKNNLSWIIKQTILPFKFFLNILRNKIEIAHINTALVPLSVFRDFILTFVAKFLGCKVLLHLHGGRFLMEKSDNFLLENILGEMLHLADKVLVLSEIEKTSLQKRWKNLNIEVLPNAVEIDEFVANKTVNKPKKLIFLGRILESKGIEEIIESIRIIEQEGFDYRFECFGKGSLEEYFLKEMREISGEKFKYGGVISGKAKVEVLKNADILFLPSRYGEGLPLAMLEAMAAKCVPLVADVASVRSVIIEGNNGLMVEPYNIEQIVEKLKFLLGDEADLETLGNNARRTVEENYSMKHYVFKLEKLYQNL